MQGSCLTVIVMHESFLEHSLAILIIIVTLIALSRTCMTLWISKTRQYKPSTSPKQSGRRTR